MEKTAIRIVYVRFSPIPASDPLLTPTGFRSGKDGIAQGRGTHCSTASFRYGCVDFTHTLAPISFPMVDYLVSYYILAYLHATKSLLVGRFLFFNTHFRKINSINTPFIKIIFDFRHISALIKFDQEHCKIPLFFNRN